MRCFGLCRRKDGDPCGKVRRGLKKGGKKVAEDGELAAPHPPPVLKDETMSPYCFY
jgi:hypothetical protein